VTHELTMEQQDFASEHHNLVYAFLRDKKLGRDDYYDVVVFGYLRAVRQYCSREDLRQRYAFSTIARRKMADDLCAHYKAQSCPKRKAVTVSLESVINRGDMLMMSEVVAGPDHRMGQFEAELLWDDISGLLTKPQAETLRMRVDGFSTREIACARRSPLREIEDLLSSALSAARELCMV